MRKNKDGSKTFYAVFRDHHDKQVWMVGGDTRDDAQQVLNVELARTNTARQLDGGTIPKDRTFGYYAERFLRKCKARKAIRPTTLTDYEMIVARHLLPAFNDGGYPVAQIKVSDVENYVTAKLTGDPEVIVRAKPADDDSPGRAVPSKPLSPKTVKNHMSVLKLILKDAVKDEALEGNPVDQADPIEGSDFQAHYLNESQLETLAASVPDRWKAFTYVLCFSGLRLGEVRALRWEDIDWKRNQLRVRVASSRGGDVGLPKTKMSIRRVPVRAELVEVLKAHREADTTKGNNTTYVFTNAGGGLVSVDTYRKRIFRPAVEKAGLPAALRIHDLRHSFCSILITKNRDKASLKVIQAVMGHSTLSVTMDIYAHVFPEDIDGLLTV